MTDNRTETATHGAPMSALDVANAFHRYARHLSTCVVNDESRINVGGDASWNRCDCGLDDIRLTLDRAWKGGKMHGETVSEPTLRAPEVTDEDVSRAWDVYDQTIDHYERSGADTVGLRAVLEDFIARRLSTGREVPNG